MFASSLFFSLQVPPIARRGLSLLPLAIATLLAACGTPATDPEPQPQKPVSAAPAPAPTVVAAPPPVAAPAPVIVALPHQEAVLLAARDLFSKAQLPADQGFNLVIDPLVDGTTGLQSLATSAVEKQVLNLIKTDFPRFQVKPLNSANIAAAPLVFIGTFTPINLQGKGAGERDAYRVCFALADLKTGKIVSKGFARSQTAGVDATPLPYFQDAPLWVNDKIVEGYIKTCQGTRAGDPINPDYLDKVAAIAGIDEAVRSYNAKKYRESLALFTSLLRSRAGDQPRVHTGVYLSNLKLGRREPAMQAFGKITKQGLDAKRLAVRFSFQPGGASFAKDANPYDRWLKELAGQSTLAAKDPKTCFEVAGHTGRGGSEPMNERVTLQRAEYVKQRLIAEKKELASRITTKGYGSAAALVATGRDDSSDALDRRIEVVAKACT